MMTIEHSSAFMLHIPYTAFKPFRDNNSEMTSTHYMELPTATPSYVFGTDAWAFSFTLTYSPFGYAAPVVKLDSAGIGGGKASILSDCFYLMLVQSDTTSHKKSLAVIDTRLYMLAALISRMGANILGAYDNTKQIYK